MFRKSLVFVVGVLSLLLVFGTVLTRAQEPTPPTDLPAPPGSGIAPSGAAPVADELAVPEEVSNTVALRNSLTEAQQASIQAILAQYQPQLQAIADSLPVPNGGAVQNNQIFLPIIFSDNEVEVEASTSAAEPADEAPASSDPAPDAATLQTLQSAVADLDVLQNQINQDVAAVLNSDQQAQFQVSAEAMQRDIQDVTRSVDLAAAPQADSDCYYCAYYGAYANYYAYWAYLYGYYDYYYYGNTYSYYGYFYSYYGYFYTKEGLPYASGAYFDSYYGFGYDSYDWGSTAAENFYNAWYYLYWGGYYGFYSYYDYGSYYGYYGYIYGYNYAKNYAYDAYSYGNACD